jgi:hypothetical protein
MLVACPRPLLQREIKAANLVASGPRKYQGAKITASCDDRAIIV